MYQNEAQTFGRKSVPQRKDELGNFWLTYWKMSYWLQMPLTGQHNANGRVIRFKVRH